MKDIELYLKGLFDISSSVSSRIGRSYILPVVLEKKNCVKEFCSNIKFDEFELVKCNTSLIDIFEDWLGEENLLATSLNYYITKNISDVRNIYELKDHSILGRLSGRKYGYVYFYEDLYFIEFDKIMVCLILGNNE